MLILLALSLTVARLFLPLLSNYKDDLQMQISQVVGQPILVREFDIGWHGLGPRLYLNGVSLRDRSGEKTLIGFDRAYVDISVPASLYRGQVAVSNLTLDGVELRLVRHTDGQLALEGIQPSGEANEQGGTAIFEWLFSQDRLALENSSIYWRDETRDSEILMLDQVSLYLSNENGEHHLNGRVRLPGVLGKELSIVADARGLVDNNEPRQVDFYLKGDGLQLQQWLADYPVAGLQLDDGQIDAEIWGRWSEDGITAIKGNVHLEGVELTQSLSQNHSSADEVPSSLSIQDLSGEFVWQGNQQDWSLDVDRFTLQIKGEAWPATRIHVEHAQKGKAKELIVASSYARIDDLLAVLELSDSIKGQVVQFLKEAQPRGHIHDAYFDITLADDTEPDFFARMQLDDIALASWQGKPGFEGLDIYLNLDAQGGVATLVTEDAELDIRPLFRDVWPLDQLTGDIAWQVFDDGLMIELRNVVVANQDLELVSGGQLFVPSEEGAVPIIDLQAGFYRGDVAATHRYLPVKIMSDNLVGWLDSALVSGMIDSGGLLLQGRLNKTIFYDPGSRFEIRLNASNGIVDYVDGWPRGEEVEASIAFVGTGMNIIIVGGKILDSNIKQVALELPDFLAQPPTLSIFGNIKGDSSDLIEYINQTPLQALFGNVTQDATATGDSSLQLAMKIPFATDHAIRTRGIVAVDQASLNLVHLGVDMKELNGAMEFGDHGLYAEGLLANVMGQTAVVSIETVVEETGGLDIQFKAEGQTNLVELAKRVELPVYEYLEGDSEWRAELNISVGKKSQPVEPTLRLESNLRGISVLYPKPLAKESSETRFFEVNARFSEAAASWYFDYDNETLSGLFNIPNNDDMLRGELRLAGVATLPDTAGLRVAGQLAYFDFDLWQPILSADDESETKTNAEEPSLLRWADLEIDTVVMLGQTLHDVVLQAKHNKRSWKANVHSQELIGEILLPDDWNRVLIMDLERFYLAGADDSEDISTTESDVVDPAELPPVVINSLDTRYGDLNLGKTKLVTVKKINGLAVETLTIDSKILKADIKGVWMRPQSGRHMTSLQADMNVKDLGALLSGLGYAKTIKFGRGKGRLSLNWHGPMNDPDAASLSGDVDFNFKNGRVLDVEPGAGRLLGILSITALPRRLLLDFSDLFAKGFSFDYMKGRFDIADGQAVTKNFKMDGPSARLEIEGRVGLVAEDYDQKLRVVPNVTSGLPTLAGAGILTGGAGIVPAAIMLLLEKLLKPGVDKITEIHYTITGSWADPVIEPVGGKAE